MGRTKCLHIPSTPARAVLLLLDLGAEVRLCSSEYFVKIKYADPTKCVQETSISRKCIARLIFLFLGRDAGVVYLEIAFPVKKSHRAGRTVGSQITCDVINLFFVARVRRGWVL